jgi:thiol-disulfide isomerase/thioredoxin
MPGAIFRSFGRIQFEKPVGRSIALFLLMLTSISYALVANSFQRTDLTNFKKGELTALQIHPRPLPMPAYELQERTGKKVSLKSLTGTVVVVNIWATWCGPCVKELPSLDSLQQVVGKKGVKVIGVAQDRFSEEVVPKFVDKLNLKKITILLDSRSEMMRAHKVTGLPTTLFLDRSGNEVARLTGAIDWSSEDVVRFVTFLVDQKMK